MFIKTPTEYKLENEIEALRRENAELRYRLGFKTYDPLFEVIEVVENRNRCFPPAEYRLPARGSVQSKVDPKGQAIILKTFGREPHEVGFTFYAPSPYTKWTDREYIESLAMLHEKVCKHLAGIK